MAAGDFIIVGATARLARVPVDPPRGDAIQQFDALELPIVELIDKIGNRGVGFGYTIGRGGPAVLALIRNGYDSQQTDRPVRQRRRDNLWAPVAGDHGAHGRFAGRSSGYSVQAWMNEHLPAVLAGAALVTIASRVLGNAAGER
jgi:hypothetical protein